jgi:hypothetical protein
MGMLHYAAAAQVAWVSAAEPAVVRVACSADGCSWCTRTTSIDLGAETIWLRARGADARPGHYIRDTDPADHARSTAAALLPLVVGDCEEVSLPAAEAVSHVALHAYGDEAFIAVSYRCSTGRHCTALFATRDCVEFRIVVPDLASNNAIMGLPFDFYAGTLSPAVKRHSHAVFTVPEAEPDAVYCRWGRDWYNSHYDAEEDWCSSEEPGWVAPSLALRAPAGHVIADFVVDEGEADGCGRWGAVVTDVARVGSDDSRMCFCRPHDVAVLDDSSELAPLAFNSGEGGRLSRPRRLRVFHRAESYWLCAFFANTTTMSTLVSEGRLFWGVIEWCDEVGASIDSPTLRAIRSVAELAQAHAVVGLL